MTEIGVVNAVINFSDGYLFEQLMLSENKFLLKKILSDWSFLAKLFTL